MPATPRRYSVSPTHIIGDDKAKAQHQFGLAIKTAVDELGEWAIPCQRDPEAWFSDQPDIRFAALQECRTNCPVINQCRTYAHADPPERNGIWGGQQMEPNAKVCERCGKPFGRDTNKRAQRYCGLRCAGLATSEHSRGRAS